MNLPQQNFDAYVFSKQPDYQEPTFRKEFAKAMQDLRTVVVYCFDPRSPAKQAIACEVVRQGLVNRQLVLRHQAIVELLA